MIIIYNLFEVIYLMDMMNQPSDMDCNGNNGSSSCAGAATSSHVKKRNREREKEVRITHPSSAMGGAIKASCKTLSVSIPCSTTHYPFSSLWPPTQLFSSLAPPNSSLTRPFKPKSSFLDSSHPPPLSLSLSFSLYLSICRHDLI